MKYFAIAMCLIVSGCADYNEEGCNIVVKHRLFKGSGEWHYYEVMVGDNVNKTYEVRTQTTFAVGDCIKLVKAEP